MYPVFLIEEHNKSKYSLGKDFISKKPPLKIFLRIILFSKLEKKLPNKGKLILNSINLANKFALDIPSPKYLS